MFRLTEWLKIILSLLIVCLTLLAAILFMIMSLPIYIYRWIIISAVKFSHKNYQGSLSGLEENLAMELTESATISPANTILATFVVHGHVELNEVYERVDKYCIQALDQFGNLKYSKLQQYPETRMGFVFWNQDENFKLSNHLKTHAINKSGNEEDSDTFLRNICDKLLNQPYSPNRSPWEVHLVHNYKNSDFLEEIKVDDQDRPEITLAIVRGHHCLGDGFGFIFLLMNLFDNDSKPEFIKYLEENQARKQSIVLSSVIPSIKYFVKSLTECGRLISFHFKPTTIYHAHESKKAGSQHYSRAISISVQKIKEIKRRFGVKFVTVINSSFASALGKMSAKINNGIDFKDVVPRHMVLGNILPKPTHPLTLSLHFYILLHEVPTQVGLKPIARLLKCESAAEESKASYQPVFIDFLLKMAAGHMPRMSKIFAKNRVAAVGITNFQGPDTSLTWNGKKCLAIEFAIGGFSGVCGITLSVFGYAGRVKICATAEKGIISEDDLKELMELTRDEIDLLHELAQQHDIIF